jgi:hemolysin activation/secretion protein
MLFKLFKLKIRFLKIFIGLITLNILVLKTQPATAQVEVNTSFIEVKKVEVVGNTVFDDSELKTIILPFEGQKMSLERLLQLRNQITNYYVKRGYLTSGAFIPAQEFTNGIVKIEVIEGILAEINIEGLSHLKKTYIYSRLPTAGKPFKSSNLTESLLKLRKDPLIKYLNANLVQIGLGKNILTIKVDENKPLNSQFSLNNDYSPSIGTLGITANANYHLFGQGDIFSFGYTKTAKNGLTRYSTGYSIPVNKYNGTISFKYTNADTKIIEEPVSALDIQADFETYKLSFRQPIKSNEVEELAMDFTLERIQSETFIKDDFSLAFVDGLPDGKSQMTVLRFAQEYFNQGEKSSLAVRSQFNVGIDLFDPTVTLVGIDGLFWSWQGQVQWLKKLDNLLLISTINSQLTEDQLLPVEQISLGGRNNVRGYRQNLSIGDNGVIGSVELQVPLVKSLEYEQWSVKLLSFVDAGTIWNNSPEVIDSDTLASIGLGLNYKLKDIVEARIDYSIPLIEADSTIDDISTEQRVTFFLLVKP